MLEEMKVSMESFLDSKIPEWRGVSKNDLCNKYLEVAESNSKLKDEYLTAIVARYWNSITRCYNKVYKTASKEDCYNMVVDSILYALKHHVWTNPESRLYGDPNGPDKAINVNISSAISGYFQNSNAYKRRLNAAIKSVEGLHEEYGDAVFQEVNDVYDDDSYFITSLVVDNFNKKNYFASFAIDGVAYGAAVHFERDTKGSLWSEFSEKMLSKHIRELNDTYISVFAKRYCLDRKEVKEAAITCQQLSRQRMKTLVGKTLNNLRCSAYIKEAMNVN